MTIVGGEECCLSQGENGCRMSYISVSRGSLTRITGESPICERLYV